MRPKLGNPIEFKILCEFCKTKYDAMLMWVWDGLAVCSVCRLRLLTSEELAGEKCHVCREKTEGDFLWIKAEEREYELCDTCMRRLSNYMLSMLHDHMSRKHDVPLKHVQKIIKKGTL